MEPMEQEEKSISFADLWSLFLQRAWIMALAAVVVVVGMFGFNKLTYKPEYSSTAVVYVLRQQEGNNSSSSIANEINTALKLINDFNYAVKHQQTLQTVIDEQNIDMTYEQLRKKITTTNPADTRFIEVTVTADTPEQAKAVADRLSELAVEKLNTVLGVEEETTVSSVFSYGTISNKPSNAIGLVPYLVGAVLAAVVVYVVFLIIHMLDDTVRTAEDVSKYLGVSILGEIPDAADILHRGGGYNGYQGYYGYGSRAQIDAQAPTASEKEEQA